MIDICRSCGRQTCHLQSGINFKIEINYFECSNCGYVQTETPYWLDRAYAEVINDSDTGIMVRNLANAKIVLATLLMLGKPDGVVVDCAGGYGILVRLLRDHGINAMWSDRYCKNLVARGFEHTTETADLVTSFEAFEHFLNPAEELERMLKTAPNVLFSTEIIADPAPKHEDWWYYGKEHGQHIGFFRIRTLEKLAKERGKFFLSNGSSYHLITERPVNKLLWKLTIKVNKMLPFLLQRKLKSKTWTDHDQMTTLRK